MKKYLLTTAAAIAMVAGTTAIAAAECDVVNTEVEQRVASNPETRSGYTGPMLRDIRELRNAAHTLASYGKDDACQEVANAINEMVENPQELKRTTRTGESEAAWRDERPEYTYDTTMPLSETSGRIRVNTLLGADVRGADDNTIGEVSDIVLDSSGAPAYVVIAYGGFLGLGEEESAVPFDKLKVTEDGEVLYVALTEEQLENAPRFERGSFDWVEDEGWRRENDQYYSEAPSHDAMKPEQKQ